jgi:polyisoprenoid-binding protein YceI
MKAVRLVFTIFCVSGLLLVGCSTKPDSGGSGTATGSSTAPGGGSSDEGSGAASSSSALPDAKTILASASPLAVESGEVKLSAANSLIQFVGTHVGERPDPRTGHFENFSGTAHVDGGKLQKVSVEIQTDSLTTPIGQLTTHLKTPDFFDVRTYPMASFVSTAIEQNAQDAKSYSITGDLTLHGVTKSIQFPATVELSDAGLSLFSQFSIDRSEFGMNFGPDRVVNQVDMTVLVGGTSIPGASATAGAGPAGGPGGGGPGGGGGGGRGFGDPAEFFKQQDADGDGKLSGDEIPERMRDSLETIDTDGDGSVSQAEFEERMRQFRERRGGGGAPGNAAPGNAAPGNTAPGNTAPGNTAPGNTAPGGAATTPPAAENKDAP